MIYVLSKSQMFFLLYFFVIIDISLLINKANARKNS